MCTEYPGTGRNFYKGSGLGRTGLFGTPVSCFRMKEEAEEKIFFLMLLPTTQHCAGALSSGMLEK